ncbi:MAG: carboxypeptidase regulatory-like domain-containing protein [Acidobacteriia bacterium]|nr:carboxypeptidase regulatory-like domain-containing protein [Terriglobia bacterium]
MTKKKTCLLMVATTAAGLLLAISTFCQSTTSASLTGQVSSKEEGPMEGVLVSAKRLGSTVTVTVASDKQGRYSFPQNRLQPGEYSVQIRATGFEMNDPGIVKVTAEKTATVDLKLHPIEDFSAQLTSEEWLLSMPGTQEQKDYLLSCVNCHTLESSVRAHHTADEWVALFHRMAGYAQGSMATRPQLRVGTRDTVVPNPERDKKQAEFMTTISWTPGAYALKTLPRPTGKATHVIITEYDLPRRNAMPHDVILDSHGIAWYVDFGQQYLGELDPRTGEVVEYNVPVLKPNEPTGLLDLELDKQGNFWMGETLQGGVAKFDAKTHKFTTWSMPPEVNNDSTQVNMVAPWHDDVDGKVWLADAGSRDLHRLDLATGKIETIVLYPGGGRGHMTYDVDTDAQNNAYATDMSAQTIVKVDSKTLEITPYLTPTKGTAPRRGEMDAQDRYWFGEYRGNGIGMLDTRTGHFQEWPAPIPLTSSYDAEVDKNGDAWTAGMTTDRVLRLDTKSGQYTQYLLPRSTNIRRVYIDNTTTPVTFWVGSNHGASIVKLEPLD